MAIDVTVAAILKHLGKNVKFNQPIYEAITNSLEANATKITIEIEPDLSFESLTPNIAGFTITDNGDGFTERNREAFKQFWTENKVEIGCKGSGRFTWLSVFNTIRITSDVKAENVRVTIPFDTNFSRESVSVVKTPISENRTTISFTDVTDRFITSAKNTKALNKRSLANASMLRDSILEYLLVKLFFLKNKGKDFEIVIKCGEEIARITPDIIPELQSVAFNIESDITQKIYNFLLYYHFTDDKSNSKKVFYCANMRSAQEMDKDSLGFSCPLPDNASFIMLLCSDYFDGKDDDSRNGLAELSHQKHASYTIPLLLSDINAKARDAIARVIAERYPEIATRNHEAIQEAKDAAPFLSAYFHEDTDIVKTRESLLTNARKRFADVKLQSQRRFERLLEEKNIDPQKLTEEIQSVSAIAAAELGEYVLYRENIIRALQHALVDSSYDEAYIHNIFMPMHTQLEARDAEKHLLSNLWLIDDKFMTYSYAASDVSVERIKAALGDNKDNFYGRLNRPDLSIFFNKREGMKDLIMVEFKGIHASKNEKTKSLTELPLDLNIVRNNISNINSIWSYIITTVDEDFKQVIESTDFYKEIFCDDSSLCAYYGYNKKSNAHIYIVDLRSIIADASARNKTFLDILKKQF